MNSLQIAPPDDRVIDKRIGLLLRFGVMLAATVIACGGILYLIHSGARVVSYHHFAGTPASLRSITGIALGAVQGNGLSVIQLGILLLIATPVARVLFSVLAFARERDWLYVVISGIVLTVLLYSLVGHTRL